ncbi:hypothetical protein WS90_08010 [Burkholderia cepacia]|uniref:Uncharacterized protein n=2 Tax=Burkholderia cepacia TaxID=292 RepID=A0A118KL55_BURCE|nr:hypothetical protein WS90_08010 [Burkholderia cepacia]
MKKVIVVAALAFGTIGAHAQSELISGLAGRIAQNVTTKSLNVSGATALGNASVTGTLGVTGATTLGTTTVTAPASGTTIWANSYSTTQSSANVPTVDYQFNALADYGSFPDTSTHFGFVVNGGKSVSTANTTGSWQLFRAGYTGYGGADTSSFITAAQLIMQPTPSSYNNSGNFTGSNPECIMVAGMTPTSCVGEESDVKTAVAPTNIREGIRISDIGSTAGTFGVNTDAGIGIVNGGGIGFQNGILFGDPVTSSTFPVPAGGRLIQTVATSTALQSFVDFSNISGAPTSAALTLPANIREACFGSVSNCTGGAIVSGTTANGGQLVFNNNQIAFNWASPVFTVSSVGNVSASGTLSVSGATTLGAPVVLPMYTVAGLPACTSGNKGAMAAVSDATSPAYNATLTGGGSVSVPAYCNGSNWTAH